MRTPGDIVEMEPAARVRGGAGTGAHDRHECVGERTIRNAVVGDAVHGHGWRGGLAARPRGRDERNEREAYRKPLHRWHHWPAPAPEGWSEISILYTMKTTARKEASCGAL